MKKISNQISHLSPIKLAYAIEQLKSKVEIVNAEPIAITGIGCRFPGQANDSDSFWRLLMDGMDATGEIPDNRWHIEDWFDSDPDVSGKMYSRHGAFIDSMEYFDASFFGISRKEASSMDPQQRLMLEVAWEALENGNYAPDSLYGTDAGVFVGICTYDHAIVQAKSNFKHTVNAYYASGNLLNVAAGRLSFALGLTGPSLSVDTACSSSLTAVHLACQSLRKRECSLALAGGVGLLLSPEMHINFCKARMISPDGKCKTFDAAANGYVRGEGCGVIVLKRLTDAISSKDHIIAIIRGSAVNQDGASGGLTVPSGPSQEMVIKNALESGGVKTDQVGYIEAHGTGTSLGDPIEMGSLGNVFCKEKRKNPLIVGSVKTNMGHLEAAAGIAGIIKTALILKHKTIPPHLNFKMPNPRIPWDEIQVEIPTSKQNFLPLINRWIAGVSSFGFSGINAHVVLEAHTEKSKKSDPSNIRRENHLLTISAKSPSAVKASVNRYMYHLSHHPDIELQDICYTANTCRSHFDNRIAVVASQTDELLDQLKEINNSHDLPTAEFTEAPRIVFMFTGQGAQYSGMGKELFETQPVFRMVLEDCDTILRDYLEIPLLDLLYSPQYKNNAESPLHDTAYTQPALFAIEYALACLWKSWGINPDVVMGHSVGEYTAACFAGVFSFEDGLKLIAARGRLMQALPHDGEMWAVFTNEQNIIQAIKPYPESISIAAYNGPESIVISGKSEAMQLIIPALKEKGIRSTQLKVSHAFHSPLMEPMLDAFSQVANDITYHPPKINLVSNVTGNISVDITKPDYWVRHIRKPVRFLQTMNTICNDHTKTFLIEIGPKPILIGMSLRFTPKNPDFLWMPSIRPMISETKQMLISLSEVYKGGISVQWSDFYQGKDLKKIPLPLYPFQRDKYLNISAESSKSLPDQPLHPLIHQKTASPLVKEIIFQSRISPLSAGNLKDHIIYDHLVVPAAYYLSTLLGASGLMKLSTGYQFTHLLFPNALILSDRDNKEIQLIASPEKKNEYQVKIISLNHHLNESMLVHAEGQLIYDYQRRPSQLYINEVKERCMGTFSGDELYNKMNQFGFDLGPGFQWVKTIWQSNNEVLCLLKAPETVNTEEIYQIHPGLIDSFLQPFFLGARQLDHKTYVPFRIDKFNYFQPVNQKQQLWSHTIFRNEMIQNQRMIIDTRLYNNKYEPVAEVIGLELREVGRLSLLRNLSKESDQWVYTNNWVEKTSETEMRLVPKHSKKWLIVSDYENHDLSKNLGEHLTKRGHQCIFGKIQDETGQVQLGSQTDFLSLLNQVDQMDGIIFCPGFKEMPSNFNQCNASTFQLDTLLHLVQAIISKNWQHLPGLFIVTRQSQSVGQHSLLNIHQSPLWGVARVIHHEYPSLNCVCMDLDKDNHHIDLILNDLISPEPNEYQIAYRNEKRYCQRFTLSQLKTSDGTFIKDDCAYLITGGTGSLGFQACKWLTEQGAKYIILTARNAPDSTIREKINILENTGVKILFIEADISIESNALEVFGNAEKLMPQISGIIHTAGVLDDAILRNQTIEKFNTVLKPKTSGAWNLHVLSKDLNLDFLVFFSSAVSVIGSSGQSNYAAANAFMDALAHYRHSLGLPALSINWGPWEGSTMMDALDTANQNRWSDRGLQYINYHNGFEILQNLISEKVIQACVMPVKWKSFLAQYSDNHIPGFYENFISQSSSPIEKSDFMDQLKGLDIDAQNALLFQHVQKIVSEVMGLNANEKIGSKQRLFDAGMDSLMAITLKNRLEMDLGHSLVPTLVFDYPMITSIVQYIMTDVLSIEKDEEVKEVTPVTYEVKNQTAELDALSEDELASLLMEELG